MVLHPKFRLHGGGDFCELRTPWQLAHFGKRLQQNAFRINKSLANLGLSNLCWFIKGSKGFGKLLAMGSSKLLAD